MGNVQREKEQSCRWSDPTQEVPIIIEIDCSTNPLAYLESVGVSLGGEKPQRM